MVSEGTEVTEYPAAHTSLCEGGVIGHFQLSMVNIDQFSTWQL